MLFPSAPIHTHPREDVPAVTRERLWLLYCVARFSTSGIEKRAGWNAGKVRGRVQAWRIGTRSSVFYATEYSAELLRAIASRLGCDMAAFKRGYVEPQKLCEYLRSVIGERLDELLQRGQFDWSMIDRLAHEYLSPIEAEVAGRAGGIQED